MLRKHILYAFLVFLSVSAIAQKRVKEYEVSDQVSVVKTNESVTAIAIRTDEYLGGSVSVTFNGKAIPIPFDADAPDFTYFRSLDEPVSSASIESPSDATWSLYLINSGPAPFLGNRSIRFNRDECAFDFNSVPQSEWREGLATPNYNRSYTDVRHVVVHHSAGSNTSTNYTQVVRDIYLFHTEVNGWSDIGYNYLIAQDGTVYAGRDPADGAQDNVLGAHFCGSNSRTMGVCLLGNYEEAVPTSNAWSALQQVAAFKLEKEELDPFEMHSHSLGTFPSIIGHRDGCSTLCPGENVYKRLDELRSTVDELLENCIDESEPLLNFLVSTTMPNAGESITITNQSIGYSHFKWIFEGGSPGTAFWLQGGEVSFKLPGIYDVTLIGYRANTSDTLFLADTIAVEGEPVVYPNPVLREGVISIAADNELQEVQLYGLFGMKHPLLQVDDRSFRIPPLRTGIYILHFRLAGKKFVHRLLIN